MREINNHYAAISIVSVDSIHLCAFQKSVEAYEYKTLQRTLNLEVRVTLVFIL